MSEVDYRLHEGLPGDELLSAIVDVSNIAFGFGEATSAFKSALEKQESLLFCLAFEGDRLVGFKVGFRQARPRYFESWRGAVRPDARRMGIGSRLMELQHAWCAEQGFSLIVTECHHRSVDMLRLNLSHGLLVTGSYLDRNEHVKLLLQKDLRSETE